MHVAPAPPSAFVEHVAHVPPPPEDLLTQQPRSNLDIAALGPRAAGKLLKQTLEGGMDRCATVVCSFVLFASVFC